MTSKVAALQGVYYIATGVWPILNMYSFEAVTGPKTDDWLVRTVGVLVIVVGLVLLSAAMKRQVGAPIAILGIGTAFGMAFIDFFYAMRGVIWPIYMLDGLGELALIGLWAVAMVRDRAQTAHV
jgi:hydrogenase/urease accessory protein HupE